MKIDPPFELDPNVKVRTRFAPSPTGYLHVGGARTALYSWLFAKHNNGEFVLRIEDTDLERSTPEATAAIIEGMEWLNLAWEHGPYYQTKRFDRYNQVIDEMIEQGLAYRCYCSKERLEELRHTQEQNKEKPRYDRHCLHDHNHAADEPHVVRFKNPTEGSVVFDDAVRGRIEISNSELDDLIIRRTDGSPTYNFCVVVDDWDLSLIHISWIDSNRKEDLMPFHNALTPADEMIPEGITVALGTDNICDYMVPLCEGDLWQELSLLAAGCRFPHLDAMVDIASINGRKVLGLEPV